jgi:hypothetical protein
MRRLIVLWFAVGLFISVGYSDTIFQIHGGEQTKGGVPKIRTLLSTKKDIASKETFARVHLFDADKKFLITIQKPESVEKRQPDSDMYMIYPGAGGFKNIKKDTQLTAEFEVPLFDMGGKKWSRFIVVFGNDKEANARAYPNTPIDDYEFPEKELVLKSKSGH